MILPVSGIVHAGFHLAHDRYSYLSGLAFALLAGGLFATVLRARAEGRLTPRLGALLNVTALVSVLALAADTWRQSKLWHDSETLWAWAVDVDPDCAICYNNLGSAIIHSPARTSSSAALAKGKPLALRPDRPTFYHNLGGALALQGRYAEAEVPLREFMRLSTQVPEALGRLGMLYVDQGRYGKAIPSSARRSRWSRASRRCVPIWCGPSGRRPRRFGGGAAGRSEDPGGRGRHRPEIRAGRPWSFPESLTDGGACRAFGQAPGHVICPLVLTVLSWYSLSNFQDPSHATQA